VVKNKKKNFFEKKNRNKHALIKISRKTKFKRVHKGLIKGYANNIVNSSLRYGIFGLKILKPCRLKQEHIDAFRETLSRKRLLKKKIYKMWIRGILNIPVSKKPNEIRMGKGKGIVNHWVLNLKPGKIFIELNQMPFSLAKRVFKAFQASIGVPCQMICRITKNKRFRFSF